MRAMRVALWLLITLTWLGGLAGQAWAAPADATPPDPPVILGISTPGLLCGVASQPDDWPGVEVMGLAEPGSRLQLWLQGPCDVAPSRISWLWADDAGRWRQEIAPLEPGCYRFQVGSCDAADNWSWGGDLEVELVPGEMREVVVLQQGAVDDDPHDGLTYLDAEVADTSLCAWAPQRNYGDSTRLCVRYGAEINSLLRFDLGALPPGVRIERATLALYCTGRSNPHPLDVQAYRVQSDWLDAEATCNQASASATWELPGANGQADRDLTPSAAALIDRDRVWRTFDITPLVGAWYAAPSENHGVLLKGAPDISVQYDFASSEYPDARLRPMLWLALVVE